MREGSGDGSACLNSVPASTGFSVHFAREPTDMRSLFAERLGALNDRWLRLLRNIEKRAEAPEMQDVAGGKTGLLRCRRKSMGFGENRMIVNEFSVDTGLLRALLALEKQAAREVGDWEE